MADNSRMYGFAVITTYIFDVHHLILHSATEQKPSGLSSRQFACKLLSNVQAETGTVNDRA